MIDSVALKARQDRLVAELKRLKCGMAVLLRPESIQWLTGAYVGPLFQPAASIDDEGRVTLVMPSRKVETPALADKVCAYEEKRLSTMRDASEQRHDAILTLLDTFSSAPNRAACEFSLAPQSLFSALAGDWIDFDPVLFRLRRKKAADELALMARANQANEAMYARAREIIEPGLNELDLYNELQTVAVRTLGEPLTYFGQDFRANARGGAPRDRAAEAGEMWILDLGVGYRGYFTDNARTIAVGEPTDLQRKAHERLAAVFPMIEAKVRPGVKCQDVFNESVKMLADAGPGVFNHHLGHGVGLAPHEAPHLNPNWDDTFEVGDYFTAEPGLYHDDLRHGLRLEQNYVVTESGVELLTDWPLGM
ncbi:putative peptidase [Botrimarina colliarenosi]|uniref:Putative peptidase n=1 Tax=Botrimarina colliarenosi TaxID=2528001 RepID=A0A5C6A2D8_9BACT|nr:Xaa-Pro peptidase family protein [Botrimarina colliarenosi]TWT94022.1 putative peptidase [Botrimarina colliarenosi]